MHDTPNQCHHPANPVVINHSRVVGSLFLLALLLRLIYLAESIDNPFYYFPIVDEAFYINQGRLLAAGAWLGDDYTFHLDPLYSYLLAISFLLSDKLFLARMLQIVADCVAVILIVQIGQKLWNKRSAIFAGIIYACYGLAIFYSPILLKASTTALGVLIVIRSYLWSIDAPPDKRNARWLITGGLLGLLALLRGNFVLLLPLVLALQLATHRQQLKPMLIPLTSFILGFCLVISIALARNYFVQGEWQAISNNSGYVAYSAFNPDNHGGNHGPPAFVKKNDPLGIDYYYRQEAKKRLGTELNTNASVRYWFTEAIHYLWNNRYDVPRLLLTRIAHLISNTEIPSVYNYYDAESQSQLLGLPLFNYAFVFGLGIPGLMLAIGLDKRAAILVLPCIVIMVTCLCFYTAARLRFPLVPCIALGTGFYLNYCIEQWQARRMKPLSISLMAGAALILSSLIVPAPTIPPNNNSYQLASAYANMGQFDKALETMHSVQWETQHQDQYYFLQAQIALLKGDYVASIALNKQALSFNPEHIESLYNVGIAQLKLGQAQQAIHYFETANRLRPDALTWYQLAKSYQMLGHTEKVKQLQNRINQMRGVPPHIKQLTNQLLAD